MKKFIKMFSVAFMLCLTAFAFAGCGEKPNPVTYYQVTASYDTTTTPYNSLAEIVEAKKVKFKDIADINTMTNILWKEENGKLSELLVDANNKVIKIVILQAESNKAYTLTNLGKVDNVELARAFDNTDIDHRIYFELTKISEPKNLTYPAPAVVPAA